MNLLLLSQRVLRDLNKPNQRHSASLDEHVKAAMDWLCLAQDVKLDRGVSLRYSLIKGWDASYPETTGYIIPTFFQFAALTQKDEFFQRAIQMAEWELSIQKPDGSFNGGALGSGYDSFVFDTGQVVFGLLEAHRVTGIDKFLEGAIKAGQWLIQVQDSEGMWRKHTFNSIPHVYYTMVAWALAEIGNYAKDEIFSQAACRNIDWALTKQMENGWFDCAGFTEKSHCAPFTHTIAYTIEGVLETGICLNRPDYIRSAKISADALRNICQEGFYYGTYDHYWRSDVKYSCLTGNAQIAFILLRLYEIYHEEDCLKTAQAINRFLCNCQDINKESEIKGAISGSYPIWGGYQRYAFPNWAAKFFVDALLLENKLNKSLELGFK